MTTNKLIRSIGTAAVLLVSMGFGGTAFADKYDGVTVTFDWPVEFVQKAAVDALTVAGAELNKQEPMLVEGKRKNKMGVMVGSGGEILSVKLTAIDANKTEANIRTTKTFVGRAGQKVWDQAIIDEMNKTLNGETSTAAKPTDTKSAAQSSAKAH